MAAAKGSAAPKSSGSSDWWYYIGGAVALGVGIGLTVYAYRSDKKQEKAGKKLRHVLEEVENSFTEHQKHIIRHIDRTDWNKFDTVTLNTTYNAFRNLLANPNRGILSRGEFEHLMKSLGISEHAVIGSMYRIWDRNGDGQIDFVEFVHSLNDLVHGSTYDRLHRYFRLFDLDANGSITRDELVKLTHTFIKGFDEKQANEYVNSVMAGMDTNRDHRISYSEFEKYAQDPMRGGKSFSAQLAGGFERQLLAAFGVTPEHIKK